MKIKSENEQEKANKNSLIIFAEETLVFILSSNKFPTFTHTHRHTPRDSPVETRIVYGQTFTSVQHSHQRAD